MKETSTAPQCSPVLGVIDRLQPRDVHVSRHDVCGRYVSRLLPLLLLLCLRHSRRSASIPLPLSTTLISYFAYFEAVSRPQGTCVHRTGDKWGQCTQPIGSHGRDYHTSFVAAWVNAIRTAAARDASPTFMVTEELNIEQLGLTLFRSF